MTRRTLLTAGTAATAAALLATSPAHATGSEGDVSARLRALEEQHGARLGVFAHNLATKRTVCHRADERFPICSLFKTLAAAAVLRDLDRDGEVLNKRIHYTAADLVENSKQTEAHLATGMTVAELADVAIRFSDNTAGNLLLRELGGPTAITRFARSLGDPVTRLDRWETDLNSAEPWLVTDTTSPRAIGRTYARLVLGNALNRPDRDLLTHWLLNNTTSVNRFRAGLPKTWTIADKTGGGFYGANNDAGIAWTEDGTPLVLVVQTTQPEQDAAPDHALIVETAELLAETLT
ncbi:class A beta-lactamase [Streptomyces cyaneochromogenes]|uniref:Beta-lactamase n=1 Tax=Streptomyces cyaneochromogenes TaxID=2496836 RepID=A0A3S9MMM5_9ACTN|nr:class A beta-lactamase [Streptomyces cyaneochromogenes]AZQ40403.1 class A beta-lactamase [Streptomyces cyaneochromogenes]